MKEFVISEAKVEIAVLVGLITQTQDERKTNEYLDELAFLAETAGAEVVKRFTQKLPTANSVTYVGKGKLEEIKQYIRNEEEEEREVGMVIFDDELSPLQVKNLTDQLQTEVTDRTDLILRIFEQRAQTKEAKLQVEIARDQYLLPRLAGMQEHMSHQQGGSGFRGSGEKQIELDRRIISRKLSRSRKELAQIVKQRQTQRERRKRNNVPVIALVGYTNSGKSTLLNTLCQNKEKKVFEKDMLFATLQTSTRNIKIKNHTCLLTDTVGFIERLPHNLIQAFRSTLEEVKEADLLLHVVDSSFEDYQLQVDTTNKVLEELGVENTPMIYVYNKVDLNKYGYVHPVTPYVFISAKEKIGLDLLEDEISHILFKDYETFQLGIPYDKGEDFKYLYEHTYVEQVDYRDDYIYLQIEAKRQDIKDYLKYLLLN